MRILYHHRTLGDGAEGIHIAEMVNAFQQLGHKVKINALIGSQTNVSTPKVRFWEVIRKSIPNFAYELTQIIYSLIGYMEINRLIKQYKPNMIYKRHAKYDFGPILAARWNGIPIILEVNCVYSGEGLTEFEPMSFRWLAKKFERWICFNTDRNIAVSTPLKNELAALGVPNHETVVMPNGANPEKFNPAMDGLMVREKYGINDKILLGFVGTLWKWHGIGLLLQTLCEINCDEKNLHLLIVGDGPYRKSLEEFVDTHSLRSYVTFTGKVPHKEVIQYIAAMDITVLPAERRAHASPMKILEYMAMEKPTIAPKMANIAEIISDNEDGLLFEPENKEKLKRAILKLVHDKKLRRKLGTKAREKILTKRNWINNAKEVLQIYEEICLPRLGRS